VKRAQHAAPLQTQQYRHFVRLEKDGRSVKPVALFTDFDIQVNQKYATMQAQEVA
jgi:predicted transcriptional regulator